MIKFQVEMFEKTYAGTAELNEKGLKDLGSVKVEGLDMDDFERAEFLYAVVTDKITYIN